MGWDFGRVGVELYTDMQVSSPGLGASAENRRMQLPALAPLSAAAWQLTLAHPNPLHWKDESTDDLRRELEAVAAQLQHAEQLLALAAVVERVAGV